MYVHMCVYIHIIYIVRLLLLRIYVVYITHDQKLGVQRNTTSTLTASALNEYNAGYNNDEPLIIERTISSVSLVL
jgi:hypothetical protein